MQVGIAFTPFETRSALILRLAEQADRAGLARVDVAEGWTLDAPTLLTEIAVRTERIGIGTGVLSTWGRTPGTIAMAAAALQRSSGGRFTLGLGSGSPPLAEGFHGTRWDRPLDRLRGTVVAVRALLRGERLPDPAEGARGLRLGVVPDVPVPLGLAALAPQAVRIAGELADAWAPFLWARSRLEEGRGLLQEGESRAETPTPTRLSIAVPAALAPDERSARGLAAWWLSTYGTRMGPLYPKMLGTRFGMADGLSAVVEAAANGSADLPARAEELADEVTLLGTHREARTVIDAWFDAGADSVHVVLPPGRPEEELSEIVAVAAEAGSAVVG